ncbi:hypothetical protein [Devosia sp. DBB001]|nr:hypothetical protein [Devosia sp. DBB001]
MIQRTSAALAALLVAAAPVAAAELTCSGALGPDSSEARLIETYGKENVTTGEVPGAEGETMLATTVFPNDEAKSFQVGWWDEERHEQLAWFTVPASDVAPGGVQVGQTVAEVQALNGEPFTLLGFYWDYGGTAGFDSGKLASLPGDCSLSLTFQPTKDLAAGVDDTPVVGDKEVASTEPLLVDLDARVESITMSYPDPNASEEEAGGGEEAGGETAQP